MAKTQSQLWEEAAKLNKEGENVANAKATADKLPFLLKDEFRKAGDPALDTAINKAQSDMFGGAIKGLNMYQDITNPFARRDLAEQYQGGLSQDYANLTDERTRRQGVYADYISKWSGLYGAEAARQDSIFKNQLATFDREKNLADTDESNRRWNIENARASANSAKSNSKFTDEEVKSFVYSHKNDMTWQEQHDYLGEKGVDVEQGGVFDITANGAWKTGNHPIKPGTTTGDPSTINTDQKATAEIAQRKKIEEFKSQVKGSESEAGYGEYYWNGGKIYKKVNWGTDEEVNVDDITR